MFLRRIPQSLRVARVLPPSPFIHRISKVSARTLISAINLQPTQLFANDAPNIASFASVSERSKTLTPKAGTTAVVEDPVTPPSIQDYESGLTTAFSRKEYKVVNPLIAKLVHLYRAEPSVRLTLFHDILQRNDVDQLSDETIIEILHLLRASPYEATRLNPDTLHHIFQQRGHHKLIHNALIDIVKLWLQDVTIPSGPTGLQYQPPATIKETFLIVESLITKQPQPALNLFNELVEKGFIPDHAVSDFDLLGSGDPRLVMFVGLAKAALHWEWPVVAAGCIQSLLKTNSREHILVPYLVTEIMTHLVDNEVSSDPSTNLKPCLDLIRAAHIRSPAPEDVIRRFYEIARESNQSTEAQELYHFTRSDPVRTEHSYPPPRGYALGWLMEKCYGSSQYQHLCKILAEEVVYDRLSLPIHCCPRFVRITASTGNITLARELWDRFRVGKDGSSLVGNGDLFFVMVQEVTNLIRKMKAKSQTKTTANNTLNVMGEKRGARFDADLVEHWESFLRRVVLQFERHRKDPSRAPRRTVICHIRACFLLGKFKTGFWLLRCLARRRQTPDIEDLNFCLGKIAEGDPQSALQLIHHMDEVGVLPNTRSYLNVLYQAKGKRDWVLVDHLADTLFAHHLGDMGVKDFRLLLRVLVVRRRRESQGQYKKRLGKLLDFARAWSERHNVPLEHLEVALPRRIGGSTHSI